MTCQTVQNKVLALPDPRLVPDPLRDHVVGCAACREWARQAAVLEGLLERLGAPPAPADKKSDLLGDLTRPGAIIARPAARVRPVDSRVLVFLRRNVAMVGGLAAAILVAVGVWALFPRSGKTEAAQSTPEHPILKKMVQRDVALAKADTPAKRLKALADMADDLSAEARALARVASAEEMKDLARWYDKVVKDALVKQAEKMPVHAMTPAERKAQFEELATKLGATATEAEQMTGEVPADAKPALQRIAESARDGQKKLRELNN